MQITNNYIHTKIYNKVPFKSTYAVRQKYSSTAGDSKLNISKKNTNGAIAGAFCAFTLGAIALFNKNNLIKVAKVSLNKIDRTINKKKIFKINTLHLEGKDLNQEFKNGFEINVIQGLMHPFEAYKNSKGENVKKLTHIPNGYMLTGPDSKAKEDTFNWMLSEMEKAGAEIIDPGHGKKAKFDEINDAWWKMWKSNNDEEFKKTGKYRVFVVRGLDEIGVPKSWSNKNIKFPEGYILKDSPDSCECREKHGIILLYTCKNASVIDPAVIRGGRIDYKFVPKPYDSEPIDIWKEYLNDVKTYGPPTVINRMKEGKKILKQRGKEVMKEIEPYFAYTVPYETPLARDPIKKWKKFIDKQNENVDRNRASGYIIEAVGRLRNDLPMNEEGDKKFLSVLKMAEDFHRDDELKLFRTRLRYEIEGGHPAYADLSKDETGAEYMARWCKENNQELSPLYLNTLKRLSYVKKGSER